MALPARRPGWAGRPVVGPCGTDGVARRPGRPRPGADAYPPPSLHIALLTFLSVEWAPCFRPAASINDAGRCGTFVGHWDKFSLLAVFGHFGPHMTFLAAFWPVWPFLVIFAGFVWFWPLLATLAAFGQFFYYYYFCCL